MENERLGKKYERLEYCEYGGTNKKSLVLDSVRHLSNEKAKRQGIWGVIIMGIIKTVLIFQN